MARTSNWIPFDDTHVMVDRINGKPKKITGTRLGAVLNANTWKTPFQAWCEITRVAEPPFEGNKYTEAGKAIEPKIIEWCQSYVSPEITTPEDVYGEDFFNKTFGDFFPESKCFGGMWDALYYAGGNLEGVIECKTSSRPQDWQYGIPKHYLVQGQLYAYLLGVKDVYFAVAFLKDGDYESPDSFVCTEDNTVLYHAVITDEFLESVSYAERWWDEHVKDKGISPEFDSKKDAEYLKLMKTREVSDASTADAIIEELGKLDEMIEAIRSANDLDRLENDRKVLTDRLKSIMMESFTDDSVSKSVCGPYTLSKTARTSFDKKAMEKDGVLEKYAKETVSYRLTRKD